MNEAPEITYYTIQDLMGGKVPDGLWVLKDDWTPAGRTQRHPDFLVVSGGKLIDYVRYDLTEVGGFDYITSNIILGYHSFVMPDALISPYPGKYQLTDGKLTLGEPSPEQLTTLNATEPGLYLRTDTQNLATGCGYCYKYPGDSGMYLANHKELLPGVLRIAVAGDPYGKTPGMSFPVVKIPDAEWSRINPELNNSVIIRKLPETK